MKRLLILMTLILTACSGGKAVAPLGHYDSHRSKQQAQTVANAPLSYTVRKGDTLYSISFRYGMDYRDLARVNGIGPPYTIYVGQKLKFKGAPAAQGKRVASSQPKSIPPPRSEPKTQAASQPKPPASQPKQASAKPAESSSKPIPPAPGGTATPAWRWPTQGPILSSFSNSSATRKGIKIAGKAGQDVVAAAAGRVVYSGNGLPRYGNLLIIKHNDVYLSAYAHNQSLLVKEGDSVRSGQKIATLGRTGTQRDQLHFEIRRNGQPVDPMRYLPKQ
ncbi:MAG TPA: peptidoglycan DD-metalloendopeptidase family protein [Gammaproteobacteria bacterium]|nr:peptidoglycan DD-metalloendopeptidase family protein [Gammaproteobacteria bacterium]